MSRVSKCVAGSSSTVLGILASPRLQASSPLMASVRIFGRLEFEGGVRSDQSTVNVCIYG